MAEIKRELEVSSVVSSNNEKIKFTDWQWLSFYDLQRLKLINLFEDHPVLSGNNSGEVEKTTKGKEEFRLVDAFDDQYIIKELLCRGK